MEVVSALRAGLADKVGKQRFELWFGPRTRIDWDGHVLTIGAASQFFLDWIRLNFRAELEEVGEAILGRRPVLEFHVDPSSHDRLPGEAAGQLSAEVKDRFPAQWLELSSDEEAAAVAAPREFAGIGATCSPRLPEFLRARARVSLMSR